MKRPALLALMLLAAPAAQSETIVVGVFAVAPYVIPAEGKPQGALIEFYDKEIAPRMGVTFKWTPATSIARLEQSLLHGAVDFTPILAHTPARDAGGIVYAGEPHVRFEPCVAVLAEAPLKQIHHAEDLRGMKIGWSQGAAIAAFMHDPAITLESVGVVDWEKSNLEKLRYGRLQGAYFSDQYTPRYYAMRGKMDIRCVPIPAPGLALYGAFAPHTAGALAERYAAAAREAFARGRFETYLNRATSKP